MPLPRSRRRPFLARHLLSAEASKALRCARVVYNMSLLGDTTPHIQHFSPIDFAMRRRPRLSPPFPLTDKLLRTQKCYLAHPDIPLCILSTDKHRKCIRAGLRDTHSASEWTIDGVPMPTVYRTPVVWTEGLEFRYGLFDFHPLARRLKCSRSALRAV